MLDPRRVLTFREVALHGSFSRAGEALSLTQSAVSQQIAALERQAGTRLLERGRGELKVTPAGEQLLAHANVVSERLQLADRQLADSGGRAGRAAHRRLPERAGDDRARGGDRAPARASAAARRGRGGPARRPRRRGASGSPASRARLPGRRGAAARARRAAPARADGGADGRRAPTPPPARPPAASSTSPTWPTSRGPRPRATGSWPAPAGPRASSRGSRSWPPTRSPSARSSPPGWPSPSPRSCSRAQLHGVHVAAVRGEPARRALYALLPETGAREIDRAMVEELAAAL